MNLYKRIGISDRIFQKMNDETKSTQDAGAQRVISSELY